MNSKINIPLLTVSESQARYSGRRRLLLDASCGPDMDSDLYGKKALANLDAKKWVKESNAHLQKVANWFENPHPKGRDHRGECDFAAIKLARAYHQFKDGNLLENLTLDKIKEFFLTFDFQSKYTSENHRLLFHTSRYLMANAYPEEVFGRYGLTGEELRKLEKNYILEFLRFRARQGWEEFDSVNYFAADWECLCCLYDFACDDDVKRMAGMLMDVFLMDYVLDSLWGMCCGAHGRINTSQAHDHIKGYTYPIQYLYFGNVCSKDNMAECVVDALLSQYRPSELLIDIALNRNSIYENYERKHLHCSTYLAPQRPLKQEPGSIRKYTYWTPEFVMGCVQYQDPYPEGSLAAWYAHHQQHQWDLTIGTRTNAKIFTHHPGSYGAEGAEHGYWTGDMGCGCGHFFQNKSTLITLYHIPENQPYHYIHAYVPKNAFDEVIEEGGYIFIREGNVFAALKMLGGHQWTNEGEWSDAEVISEGTVNGVLCEAGTNKEFGTFDAFRQETLTNRYLFDAEKMQLTYESKRCGILYLDIKGGRKLNGKAVDLDYDTYSSPYMKAGWDTGIVEFIKGNRKLIYDFNKLTIEEGSN